MTKATNPGPVETLRDGFIKATIWRNAPWILPRPTKKMVSYTMARASPAKISCRWQSWLARLIAVFVPTRPPMPARATISKLKQLIPSVSAGRDLFYLTPNLQEQ